MTQQVLHRWCQNRRCRCVFRSCSQPMGGTLLCTKCPVGWHCSIAAAASVGSRVTVVSVVSSKLLRQGTLHPGAAWSSPFGKTVFRSADHALVGLKAPQLMGVNGKRQVGPTKATRVSASVGC